ncbi:hypothetical protein Nmel_002335 [Mimus melanotis]
MGIGKCEKSCMFNYVLKTPLLYKVCVILKQGTLHGISPGICRKKNEKFKLALLASLSQFRLYSGDFSWQLPAQGNCNGQIKILALEWCWD